MKKAFLGGLIVLLVLLLAEAPVVARPARAPGRGGNPGVHAPIQGPARGRDWTHYHGTGGRHWRYGPYWGWGGRYGWSRGFYIGSPWWWWDPYPFIYPYPVPYPSQTVVVQEQPPVYIERQAPGSDAPAWYYCPSSRAYYPSVKTCPEEWIRVAPEN